MAENGTTNQVKYLSYDGSALIGVAAVVEDFEQLVGGLVFVHVVKSLLAVNFLVKHVVLHPVEIDPAAFGTDEHLDLLRHLSRCHKDSCGGHDQIVYTTAFHLRSACAFFELVHLL